MVKNMISRMGMGCLKPLLNHFFQSSVKGFNVYLFWIWFERVFLRFLRDELKPSTPMQETMMLFSTMLLKFDIIP